MKIRHLCCVSVLFLFLAACSGLSVYHPTEEEAAFIENRRETRQNKVVTLTIDPASIEPFFRADWTFLDPFSPYFFTMNTPAYGIRTGISSMSSAVYGISLLWDMTLARDANTGVFISIYQSSQEDFRQKNELKASAINGINLALISFLPEECVVNGLQLALIDSAAEVNGVQISVLPGGKARAARGIVIAPYNGLRFGGAIGLWNENYDGPFCGQVGIFNRHWSVDENIRAHLIQIGVVCSNHERFSNGVQIGCLLNMSSSECLQIGMLNGLLPQAEPLRTTADEKENVAPLLPYGCQIGAINTSSGNCIQLGVMNAGGPEEPPDEQSDENPYGCQIGAINRSSGNCIQLGVVNAGSPEERSGEEPDENQDAPFLFQLGLLWNNKNYEDRSGKRAIQFALANRSEGKALQLGLLNFNTSEDAFLPFCPFFNYN